MEQIRGYKAFNKDWTCRGKQYEVGKMFEEDVELEVGAKGMHFCKRLCDCFNYYTRDKSVTNIAEVLAVGDCLGQDDLTVTNKLVVLRELGWNEVINLCNTGNWNTGNRNAGNKNTGDWNTGNWNTGHWNTGNCNAGNRNAGNWNAGNRNAGNKNTGNCNTGNCNTGNCNAGNCNTGDWNAGNRNAGNCNTGDWNTGNWNTGHWNTGNCNAGNRNTGNWNAGNCNAGDWNTGNRNAGNWNAGDWNTANYSSGCFNTTECTIRMFNKPSDMSMADWLVSDSRAILNRCPCSTNRWVYSGDMTDEEKTDHPEHTTTGGYLKTITVSDTEKQEWWDGLEECEREYVMALPNFDKAIFYECTGIEV